MTTRQAAAMEAVIAMARKVAFGCTMCMDDEPWCGECDGCRLVDALETLDDEFVDRNIPDEDGGL